MKTRFHILLVLALALRPLLLLAHPMGNFSINHHSTIHVTPTLISVTTILDFAEISTLQLFPDPRKASDQANAWISRLHLMAGGRTIPLTLRTVQSQIVPAPTGLPTLRVQLELTGMWTATDTMLTFKDENYPSRIGWKEVVIDSDASLKFVESNPHAIDRSRALTAYPDDLSVPPEVTSASVRVAPAGSAPRGRTAKRAAIAAVVILSIGSLAWYFRRKEK